VVGREHWFMRSLMVLPPAVLGERDWVIEDDEDKEGQVAVRGG
jgi:hypothetical protein